MEWYADGYTFRLGEGGYVERTDFFCCGEKHYVRVTNLSTGKVSWSNGERCHAQCLPWLERNKGVEPPDVHTPEERFKQLCLC